MVTQRYPVLSALHSCCLPLLVAVVCACVVLFPFNASWTWTSTGPWGPWNGSRYSLPNLFRCYGQAIWFWRGVSTSHLVFDGQPPSIASTNPHIRARWVAGCYQTGHEVSFGVVVIGSCPSFLLWPRHHNCPIGAACPNWFNFGGNSTQF